MISGVARTFSRGEQKFRGLPPKVKHVLRGLIATAEIPVTHSDVLLSVAYFGFVRLMVTYEA